MLTKASHGRTDRLAGLGYVALIPDVYYRETYEPFDPGTAFSDESERNRLFGLMFTLTNDRVMGTAGSRCRTSRSTTRRCPSGTGRPCRPCTPRTSRSARRRGAALR